MRQKRKLGRKLLGFLLTLAMVVGLMPGMSLTALADGTTYSPASEYTDYGTLNSNDTTVQIEGVKIGDAIVDWYVIGYDSTDQTVTLLSKQSFASKKFNSDYNSGNAYESSEIKGYVEGLIGDGQPLAGIKDALADINGKVTGDPSTISGAVPYLLSCAEANALSDIKKSQATELWWLRSPGGTVSCAAQVNGGNVDNDGNPVDSEYDVRPALQLDLSKVVFDSTNNSFSLKPHEHDEMTFQAWDNSTSLPTEAGNYYLGCDVTLQGDYNNENPEYNNTAVWTVPSGTTNLCLNGHSISITDKWSRLEVPNGSTLNLYDDGETGTVIQTDQDSVVSMFNINGGQLNLYSGTLSGAFAVNIEGSGTFNMYRGNVQGYRAVDVESGVFNLEAGQIIATGRGVGVGDSGNFTMSGGKITGSSSNQPAVGVSGTFTMSGGEICNNNCPSNAGGTVSVGGTFNMEGGSIYGNTAKNGGGIGVVGNGTFNLTGGSIYGNTAENGGGVYAYISGYEDEKSHVYITGGSITGNNATSWGGGIYGAENVYLSGSPQIHDNYLNGELLESVYTKGTAGANNNLCITNSGDEDNIDYFNVNGELSSDSRVGLNLPAEKLDAATYPLVISHGFGGRILEDGGDNNPYSNWDYERVFFFDREGYTLADNYGSEWNPGISEVAVGLNRVDYIEDCEKETQDYNVISGGSGNQDWSSKKTDQVIFENATIDGNIKIKNSDASRIIFDLYSYEINLTVNGSIYSDALTDGDGNGNLRVCGYSDSIHKLKVSSQTTDAPAINVKNISVYGATLELAGPEGGSALRSDAYISSPYTFIYESDDGINYTYHPYTSGSNTPIGNLKRYVKINNTEPEWIAEVTTGDDTSKYVDFANALTAWKSENGKILKLLKDVTTTDSITVTGGTSEAPLVLDLNGHGIMYTETGKAPVITVDNGGVLNLSDSYTTKKHYITLTSGRGTAVSDANSDGAIEVTGGYITGGTGKSDGYYSSFGGGVYISSGTFTMFGGTIIGNTATHGGGVYTDSESSNITFNMKGGTIKNNTAITYGGGVFNGRNSTFNMKNGEISDNKANGSSYGHGGGVSNNSTFNMEGGKITGNEANYYAGVRHNGGTFTMSGGEIDSNIASKSIGGVYAYGAFTMTGGKITNNEVLSATSSCCGVAVYGTFNLSGNPIIKGNKIGTGSDAKDNNVFLATDKKINVTDVLSNTDPIGVTMGTPGVFTSSADSIKASDYKDSFTSDDPDYTVKTEGDELKLAPAHNHNFEYSATGDTITAECKADNCPLPEDDGKYVATLTIVKPTMTTYGQIGDDISEMATITDVNSIKGEAEIKYYNATKSGETYTKTGNALTAAPTNAGDYVAEITLGEGDNEATASVGYTIAPKPVTVTGITADNKVYDGNAEARLNCESASINGIEYGDEVSLNDTATGSFSDKNVGNGKTVTISGLALTGNDAANYTLVSQPTTTANITEKSVTVTGITAENKEYDGSTNATLNYNEATIDGKVDGDNLSYNTTATGTFSDKNVGEDKIVIITGLTLTGADAANYTLASQPADTTADITAKSVTVTGITAENKIYDGSTSATLNHESATILGKVDNDDLSYNADSATGVFSNKNVGEGKTVSISGLTLTGYDSANYVLASQPASVTADISPKPVTVSGITASDKTYDGTTDATLDCANATFNGIKDNDNLTVTATGAFEDANVGDKTVNISGLTLDGTDKGNYVLAATGQQSTATATINPKSISNATVTLDKTQLTYNGSVQTVNVTNVTIDDMILKEGIDYAVTGNYGTDKNDYAVRVEGKGNFMGITSTNWKIVEKDMTVKADNVTVTYDGKEHGIKVEVVDPASGAEVKYGTTEGTYDLDECPTIIDPGTMTVYYKVTAGSNYSDYTGNAVVKVEKLASAAAKVTANNREYDGTEKPLVDVTGKAEGGKMQYALGTDSKTAPAEGWSEDIPKGTKAGTYYVWYKVEGDENHNDVEPECVVVSIKEKEKQKPSNGTITTDGIYCASNYPSIQAGMVIHKSNEEDTVEYRWVACDSSRPIEWFEVSPWTKDNNCIDWIPEKSGEYVIVCYARVVGNEKDSEIQYAFGTEYHKGIKGICQIPYTGEGGGYLIGIESYNNPNNSYRYEMVILDCTLYVQGKDAWIYTTGKCASLSNCLWTIWQPKYGYYWTLFRIYDSNGNLLDEKCFGFENVY